MQSRIEIFKHLLKEANPNKDDFSYSAIMRRVRKQHPDKIKTFMRVFKEAFDMGQDQKLDELEQAALLQAIKSVGL